MREDLFADSRSIGRVEPAYLLGLLWTVSAVVTVGLFGAFWLPLLLLVVVVALSLWLVRRYYLDYLDEPDERRTSG